MNSDTTPDLPAAPAKEKHNKLDLRSQFKLLDWVRNHEDLARTESDPKLAAMASAELDLKITPSNVMSTREALNIEKLKPAAPPTLEERVKHLENLFAAHFPLSSSPPPPVPASPESLPGLETPTWAPEA